MKGMNLESENKDMAWGDKRGKSDSKVERVEV